MPFEHRVWAAENCIPNLPGDKQSGLAAAPAGWPPSAHINLCWVCPVTCASCPEADQWELRLGKSLLTMLLLSSDQRGFNRSEVAMGLSHAEAEEASSFPLSASHGYLYPPAPHSTSQTRREVVPNPCSSRLAKAETHTHTEKTPFAYLLAVTHLLKALDKSVSGLHRTHWKLIKKVSIST